MEGIGKTIASGVVVIGLVAAVGIHSTGLTKFSKGTIGATGGLFQKVERP